MASTYRKQNRWWIHYRDGTGRWRDTPTKVDTKTAAKALAKELEQQADRQRRGLEPILAHRRVTLGEVMDLWWREYGRRLKSKTIHLFAEKHLRKELGQLALAEITPGRLDLFFAKKLEDLAPRSVNHLRSHFRRLFNIASRQRLWLGTNPISQVEKLAVPRTLPDYLRIEEVPRVLSALTPRWRPLFATAIYTGLRRGELLALRKTDVDLVAKTLVVARSHGNETTKGGHADLLPIADDLVPYLRLAIASSPSELLFPKADGSSQRADLPLQKVLRRAMGRAGIVVAYQHKCRRRGCSFTERRPNAVRSECPRCTMTLWVTPLPRPVRFHDLRHTTATLLLKAEVPLATVQKILRHTDPAITSEIYGHLDVEDMRRAVNKLSFASASPKPTLVG